MRGWGRPIAAVLLVLGVLAPRPASGAVAVVQGGPWVAGVAIFSTFELRFCASGQRVVATSTRSTVDDTMAGADFHRLEFYYGEDGRPYLRLGAHLPVLGASLDLFITDTGNPVSSINKGWGYHGLAQFTSGPDPVSIRQRATLRAGIDAVTHHVVAAWGRQGSGACYVTPL